MRFGAYITGVVLFVLGMAGVVRADVLKVERLIQLPGGKPAAGAKVLLRSLNIKDGTLKQEKRAVADEQGVVRAEIDIDVDDAMGPIRVSGYMMVDVTGMALAFESFENWRRRRDVEPFLLSAGYEIKGKILTPQGEPVGDAEIMLAAFASNWSNWRINYPSANIVTPEVITRSNADGSFELRPVDIVEQTFGNGPPVVRPLLMARATQGDVVLAGRSESFARKVGAPAPTGNVPESSIRVYPAATVRGRIVSELNGQPVAGAQVALRADPGDDIAASVRPAVSGSDGTFEFRGVPASFQLFAEATHRDFAKGWTRIGEGRNRIAGDEPRLFENVQVRLRPWADTSGRVVDVATNAPPLTPISIQAIYEEGYNDGRIAVGRGVAVARMNADGTFTMQMPVGHNHLMVRGPGYWEGGREHPIDLDIKPAGNQNLVLEVRREKGFLIRFSTSAAQGQDNYNFDKEYDLHMRGADGKESSTNWGEWWYWPLYKPDDTLEIRVTRFVDGFSQEVVPWTKLTSHSAAPGDAKHWPRRIRLPLRQTVTVRGKVVDAETGNPLRGATVKLVSNPKVAVKNIAPVTSGEDGSFTFERVPLPTEVSVTATLPKDDAPQASSRTASMRVGTGTLSAVATEADEGHQEFNDIVVASGRE